MPKGGFERGQVVVVLAMGSGCGTLSEVDSPEAAGFVDVCAVAVHWQTGPDESGPFRMRRREVVGDELALVTACLERAEPLSVSYASAPARPVFPEDTNLVVLVEVHDNSGRRLLEFHDPAHLVTSAGQRFRSDCLLDSIRDERGW